MGNQTSTPTGNASGGNKANLDNHSNQLNPNNQRHVDHPASYNPRGTGSKNSK
jgi:hypothetical protein